MSTKNIATAAANDSANEKIFINVSGKRFQTTRAILEDHPYTLLGSSKREAFFDREAGEYFFTRDVDIFKLILNFYHTGKLHYSKHQCISSFDAELEFFGISPDVISRCCYEEYLDEKQDSPAVDESNRQSPTTFREKLWECFEMPCSSNLTKLVYAVIVFIVLASILSEFHRKYFLNFFGIFSIYPYQAFILASVPCGVRPGRAGTLSCGERYKFIFFSLERIFIIFITVEYLLRLFAAADRVRFAISFISVIDILTVLPYCSRIFTNDDDAWSAYYFTTSACLALRAVRLLKASDRLTILSKTFQNCACELLSLILPLSVATLFYAVTMFAAEKDVDATNFTSIVAALWYSASTMTTLGLGDMIAETILGKIITVACSLSGVVMVFAIPISIIVSNYNRVANQKQRHCKRVEHSKPNHGLQSVEMS